MPQAKVFSSEDLGFEPIKAEAKPVLFSSEDLGFEPLKTKPIGPTALEQVGSKVSDIAGGAKAFFTGDGESIGERIPVIGPLGKFAGEGFRSLVEGGLSGTETVGQAYSRIKSENEAKKERFAKENPGANIAREAVGGVAGSFALPIIGSGAKGVAGAATRIAGATGLATTDAALRGNDIGQAARVTGGMQAAAEAIPGIGKLARPAARSVAGGLSKLADKADEVAAFRAVKAAIGNTQKEWEKLGSKVQETGKSLLDNKVVRFGSNAEKIGQRAESVSKGAWNSIDEVFKVADEAGVKIQASDVASSIRASADKIDAVGKSRTIKENMLKEADHIEALGEISLAKAQELKNRFAYKQTDTLTHALGIDGNNIINRAFGDAVKEKGRQILPDFAEVYQKSGSLGGIAKAAKKQDIQLKKNRGFSLTDYITGGAAGAIVGGASGGAEGGIAGGGLSAVAFGVANGVARKRGNAALAVSLKSLGNILRNEPERLGRAYNALEEAAKTSPAAFAAAHEILMQSSNEYKNTVMPSSPIERKMLQGDK